MAAVGDARKRTVESGLPRPIANEFPDNVAQVVLTGQTFDWFQTALRGRGLYLFPIPVGDDDLPTFGVGIGDVLMGRVTREAPDA